MYRYWLRLLTICVVCMFGSLSSGAAQTERLLIQQPQQPVVGADISTREAALAYYDQFYTETADPYAMEWTGSYDSCVAGTISREYQEKTLRRINYYRAIAGLPLVVLDQSYDRAIQDAAYMISMNTQLNHAPPATWQCYTADGSTGAGHANLAFGVGWQAIDAYMRDAGLSNADVGHRRWLLHPPTQAMGVGQVPGTTGKAPANAIWVIDPFVTQPRPPTRDRCVAYPPAGFVVYTTVFPRWSCQLPNADFSQATFSMTKDGVPISVALEPTMDNGTSEKALVWRPENMPHNVPWTRPDHDTVYVVRLENVLIGGIVQTISYTTTIIAPNDPPTSLTIDTPTLPETSPIGTIAATITVNDPDGPNDYHLVVHGDDASAFTVSGLTLVTSSTLDYETKPFYHLSVEAINSLQQTIAQSVTIVVQNMPEAPTAVSIPYALVESDQPQTLAVVVADSDSTSHMLTLVSGEGDTDNDHFTVINNQLWISAVDYETQRVFHVRLRATDPDSLWIEQPLVINVINTIEPPVWTDSIWSATITPTLNIFATEAQTITLSVYAPDGFVDSIFFIERDPVVEWMRFDTDFSGRSASMNIVLDAPEVAIGQTMRLRVGASDSRGSFIERTLIIHVQRRYAVWLPLLEHE